MRVCSCTLGSSSLVCRKSYVSPDLVAVSCRLIIHLDYFIFLGFSVAQGRFESKPYLQMCVRVIREKILKSSGLLAFYLIYLLLLWLMYSLYCFWYWNSIGRLIHNDYLHLSCSSRPDHPKRNYCIHRPSHQSNVHRCHNLHRILDRDSPWYNNHCQHRCIGHLSLKLNT